MDNLRKWQAAAKMVPHKDLVTLYKESEYQRGPDQFNKFQMTLEAASSDTFLSVITALAGRSTGSGPSAKGEKRPKVTCHACGDEGHMVCDRGGAGRGLLLATCADYP